jgi:cyanophycinase
VPGCALGGTSAGAMVWGSRTIVAGESEQALRHGVDEAAGGLGLRDGFGMLSRTIVDPHFGERDRFHRLWVAAGETPSLGIGIDPRTAASVGTDGTLDALGAGTVTLIRPEDGGAARVTVLKAGQSLNLKDWRL